MMYTDDGLLISELAEKSGLTVRTIRYYISQGLIPAPDNRGRYAVYDEDYLARLELIQRLKNAFLPLSEIRKRIKDLSIEEVKALLDLSTEAFNQQVSEYSALAEDEATSEQSDAVTYIAKILDAHSTSEESVYMQNNIPRRTPRRPDSPLQKMQPNLLRRESDWRRIEVFPGCELHIRSHLMSRFRSEIESVIEELHKIFHKSI